MVHVVIIGGSGRTGQYAVKYALEKGYEVTALVRKASSLQAHENLRIVTGSVSKAEDVETAFTASSTPIDGVAVYLNANRTSDMPWAKLIVPPRFITDSVLLCVKSLKTAQSKNPLPGGRKPAIVVISSLGVGDSFDIAGFIVKSLIKYTNLGETIKDHNEIDRELPGAAGSDIQWTFARPPMLGGDGRKPVKVFSSNQTGAGSAITRQSCAEWMLDVAVGTEGTKYSNKAVIISN